MKIDISYSRLFTFNIVINANYYIFHILATSSHLSGRGSSLTSQKTVSSLVSVNISRIHPLMFIHQRMIFTISVFTDYLLSRQLQSSKYSEQTASHIVRTFRKLALDVRRNQMSSDNNISLVTCFHLFSCHISFYNVIKIIFSCDPNLQYVLCWSYQKFEF